jgi:hypothetical protein
MINTHNKSNLFQRFNDSEIRAAEVFKINSYFLTYLSSGAKSPELLERRLKIRSTPLFRFYRHVMETEGLDYEQAREDIFEGIDSRRGLYCRNYLRG